MAEKYPNIGGYVYAANNPILFVDLDGRYYRLIMQRDKRGNIQTITLQATVYLQGNGASNELAAKLNKTFADNYGTKDINGIRVNIDVKYIHNNKIDKSNLKGGENILNVTNDLDKSVRSYVDASKIGKNFKVSNTGVINSKSPDIIRTTIHETFHFLGLSDRYDDYEGSNMSGYSIIHKGFKNDVMGSGYDLDNIHYENIINFGRSIFGPMDKNGKTECNHNTVYDREGITLKNGNNRERTNYDQTSNQAH